MRLLTSIFAIGLGALSSWAQTDLEKELEQLEQQENPHKKEWSSATFKGTRLINFHTSEVVGKRGLDFRIAHRFGEFNSGLYNFFGLDGGASIRLSLEYSYDGRLMFGLGRTSTDKQLDVFGKYRILRQTTDNSMPISVTGFLGAYCTTVKDTLRYSNFTRRMAYTSQLIIARKFNERLSLQISPTYVHYNLVEHYNDKNNNFILGAAGRYKLTKRMAITAEYGYRFNQLSTIDKYYNTFGIGIDIETGGHVFQMHFTNSLGLTEAQYFAKTNTTWSNMGVRLGFNISRLFAI